MRRRSGENQPCSGGNEASGSDGLHPQCGGCPHVSGDSANAKQQSGSESSSCEYDNGSTDVPATSGIVDIYRFEVPDMVNHPSHYSSDGIECIEAIEAQLTKEEYRGFLKGNVAKYLWREKYKGGTESLKKAQWYLTRLLELN